MMMMLGSFPFSLYTAAYQKKQRTTSQRWAKSDRVGQRAAYQYLGPGDDNITLPGVIYPELTGKKSILSLASLRAMADTGKPYQMLSQHAEEGFVLGSWIILNVDQTDSFLQEGLPQKIEFNVKLRRYSDTDLFDNFFQGAVYALYL